MRTALHRNPFYVLGATPRDSGACLYRFAEERALIADADSCQRACAQLLSPRTRLAAELGWLPGVSPDVALRALRGLDRTSDSLFLGNELPPLARANLIAADIERHSASMDDADAVRRFVDLALAVDRIDLPALLRELNADRSAAAVPLVPDAEVIAGEFETQRRYYQRVVRDMLDRLRTHKLIEIMLAVADCCTEAGTRPARRLVQDLGDSYELQAQAFIAGEAANIDHLIARARAEALQSEIPVLHTIDALGRVAANWTEVIKPMQVLKRANGIDHAASVAVASRIGNLAIWMHNERHMFEAARRIFTFLRREFDALIEFSARLDEDISRTKPGSSPPTAAMPRSA